MRPRRTGSSSSRSYQWRIPRPACGYSTLESLGVAVMREGVYLLPCRPAGARSTRSPSTSADRRSRARFARERRHKRAARSVHAPLRPFGALRRTHQDREKPAHQLRPFRPERDLARHATSSGAISRRSRRSTSSSAARERAEAALAEAEAEVRMLLFPANAQTPLVPGETLLGRTWVTRKPLWADRLACAWLIRRFVDPEATLTWLDKGEPPPPRRSASRSKARTSRTARRGRQLRGDAAQAAPRAQRGARQDRQHRALSRGARRAGGRAAGVQTLLQGAQRRSTSEGELLSEAEKTFDLLYEAYYQPPRAGG